jgi:alpha-glucosidase
MNSVGEYVDLDAPLDHIPVHLRGGRIIPVQEPQQTTTAR